MVKEKIFVIVMMILTFVALILAVQDDNMITAACDILLILMWGWDCYKLTKGKK